jgi:hypothetical protein
LDKERLPLSEASADAKGFGVGVGVVEEDIVDRQVGSREGGEDWLLNAP